MFVSVSVFGVEEQWDVYYRFLNCGLGGSDLSLSLTFVSFSLPFLVEEFDGNGSVPCLHPTF